MSDATAPKSAGPFLRCPTCRAALSGRIECRRCGTPLEGLIRIVVRAVRHRNAARTWLGLGRPDLAVGAALAALRLRRTESGERLLACARSHSARTAVPPSGLE